MFDAIAIWDFASAAPYIPILVNGTYPLDAVFFSGHKFPGGVSSPGVLIVKKSIIQATKPKRIGGGTVFFVRIEKLNQFVNRHDYVSIYAACVLHEEKEIKLLIFQENPQKNWEFLQKKSQKTREFTDFLENSLKNYPIFWKIQKMF